MLVKGAPADDPESLCAAGNVVSKFGSNMYETGILKVHIAN